MKKPLTPQDGRGKELSDLLRKELHIPEGVKSFEVRFAIDEPIAVKCEYIPRSENSAAPDGKFSGHCTKLTK